MTLLPCRAALLVLALTATAAAAQTPWPSQPIKLIVPYPAGGGTDIAARWLGQKLSEALHQQNDPQKDLVPIVLANEQRIIELPALAVSEEGLNPKFSKSSRRRGHGSADYIAACPTYSLR